MKTRIMVGLTVLALVLPMMGCGRSTGPVPTATTETTVVTEGSVGTPTGQAAEFAYASAESQGLSAEAVQGLAVEVQGYFDDGLIVGAELVVIQNRHVVLHEAIGWKDREDGAPMESRVGGVDSCLVGPVVKR